MLYFGQGQIEDPKLRARAGKILHAGIPAMLGLNSTQRLIKIRASRHSLECGGPVFPISSGAQLKFSRTRLGAGVTVFENADYVYNLASV